MKRKKPDGLRYLAVVSDLHSGCRLALMPRKGFTLDEGTEVKPSKIQLKLNDMWDEYWQWVEDETAGEPYGVVVNGDAVEGVHHGSVTQWTHNLDDQVRCSRILLKDVARKAAGRFYMVRGTEAHVGKSAQQEEALARELGAIPNEDGQHAHWQLWLRLGGHLIHFAHHIGTTSSPFAASAGLQREMVSGYVESGRWGDEPAAMYVRSHRHFSSEVREPSKHGVTAVVVTPAWQLKTPFGHKTAGRMMQPQVGGILICVGDNGPYVKSKVWRIERSAEVKL